MPAFNIICDAIAQRRLLEFEYNGLARVVAPYCHGLSTTGNQSIRAVEIGGKPGSSNVPSGKMWTVAKTSKLRLGKPFKADDPNYLPEDSAFSTIHCRI